jgi:hypothetical protein
MGWLNAHKAAVLGLAGYAEGVTRGDVALTYAEGLIEQYTGIPASRWGASVQEAIGVRLAARTYLLPCPTDVTGLVSIVPATQVDYTMERREHGIALVDADGLDVAWGPGPYKVTVQRGYSAIPQPVIKAASLLAAHYLGLSDPDRSRFLNASLGDFSGTMRLQALPVPEAAALLHRYRPASVGVSG